VLVAHANDADEAWPARRVIAQHVFDTGQPTESQKNKVSVMLANLETTGRIERVPTINIDGLRVERTEGNARHARQTSNTHVICFPERLAKRGRVPHVDRGGEAIQNGMSPPTSTGEGRPPQNREPLMQQATGKGTSTASKHAMPAAGGTSADPAQPQRDSARVLADDLASWLEEESPDVDYGLEPGVVTKKFQPLVEAHGINYVRDALWCYLGVAAGRIMEQARDPIRALVGTFPTWFAEDWPDCEEDYRQAAKRVRCEAKAENVAQNLNDHGIISKRGIYYDYKNHSWKGPLALYEALSADSDLYDEVLTALRRAQEAQEARGQESSVRVNEISA